jgi:hypothetical protein
MPVGARVRKPRNAAGNRHWLQRTGVGGPADSRHWSFSAPRSAQSLPSICGSFKPLQCVRHGVCPC